MTRGQIGLPSGRRATLGSDSLISTLSFQTWRQLWRVLEMSDIVLLITDIRHPVSPGDEVGPGEEGGRSLWCKGQKQELGGKEVTSSFLVSSIPC